MSKSTTLGHIGGHLPRLAEVVRNGFDSITRCYSDTAEVLTKTTHANLRQNHMVRAGLELLPPSEFKLVRAGLRSVFSFRSLLLVQLRKLKPNITTSNYPTAQAELIDVTGEVSGLPGIGDPLPLISVGYVMNQFLQIEGIFMTQIINKQAAWVHRIDEADDQQPPLTSILSPNDPISRPPSRIIKPADGGRAAEPPES